MKSGVIIYVAGNIPEGCNEAAHFKAEEIGIQADAVELITTESGHADIHDAWWAMQSKGMAHIVCKMARFDDSGKLVFTGRKLRLCG